MTDHRIYHAYTSVQPQVERINEGVKGVNDPAPWHAVFEAKDWDALLTRSIIPKLRFALSELIINPANQVLDQIHWVLAWEKCVAAGAHCLFTIYSHTHTHTHTRARFLLSTFKAFTEKQNACFVFFLFFF